MNNVARSGKATDFGYSIQEGSFGLSPDEIPKAALSSR
jgi:hypothetical protein